MKAIFGNRFVKVFWYRPDDTQQQQQLASTAAPPPPQLPPQSPVQSNPEVERKKREQEKVRLMLDLQKQKEQLIQRQIQHQKALMKKLEDNPQMPAKDRADIMASIKSISESTQSILTSSSSETSKLVSVKKDEPADAEMLEKLEMLKKQAAEQGIDASAVVNPTPPPPQQPVYQSWGSFRGRARGRGAKRFSLDNRPAKFYFTTPPTLSMQELKTHFGSFGSVKHVDENGVEFENRRIAEMVCLHSYLGIYQGSQSRRANA